MKLLNSVYLGIAAATMFACNTSSVKKELRKPNILIIQPDQHRADIMGCAGNTMVKTPNLDKLAGKGVRFSRAVSASPVCCPFRATMQTGLYIHEHGVVDNGIHLKEEFKGIAEFMAEAGYATGYIGKWHLGGFRPKEGVGGYIEEGEPRQGWQEWLGYEKAHEYLDVWKFNEKKEKVPVEGYGWEPTWHTDMAVDFMQRKTEEGQPWCYYIAYGPPHLPEQCIPEFLDQYDPEAFELLPDVKAKLSEEDKKELREILHTYYAQVTAVDFEVGRLMKALETMGADDNTIIVYVSDHGDVLGSHNAEIVKKYMEDNRNLNHTIRTKGKPYAPAFRIPFILSGAGVKEAGLVTDALVNSVDIVPTILELAGIEVPDYMQGTSMSDWYRKGKGPEQPYVYLGLQTNEHAWRAVWDGQYLLSELKYQHFYNHENDPYEMHDLYNNPEYQAKKDELESVLVDFATRTGDPILSRLKSGSKQ